MELRVVSKEKGAYWCALEGRKIPGFVVQDDYEAAEEGWFYHLPDRTVWVKFKKPAEREFTVTVSTEKFDLVGMVKHED